MPRYDSSMTEERVVEMRIDNDNFEKGAKETISTLEKLERALKIKGDSSAIDDMSKAVNKFDASPMAESFDVAVKSISNKAAFLQGVFNELGRDIYNFCKDIINKAVVEPVQEGMDKYTTLAETTQTLMAATKDYYIDLGITDENKQLEELTKKLDMLQWYSDETSYSFNDMADAVAKFVAAGVPIDQASQAIVGIATASAAAGANAKAASHTMQYAWAQAFGTGYMALGDFKTLENQNIATKEFKQNLLEVAADMGKISRVAKDGTDAFDDFYSTIIDPSRYDDAGYILKLSEKEEAAMFNWKNMRESLKEKWMDTDVMTEFANRYGEFSARLYDLVSAVRENGGDLEVSEARDLLEHFREVGKDDSAYWKDAADNLGLTVDELFKYLDALNNVEWKISETGFYMGQEYKTWQDVLDATRDAVSSQWMKTFQYIFGDFIEAKKLWTEVGELFYDAFVSWNVTRNNILKEWHNKGGREALLGLEEDANGFRGALWNIVDAVRSVVGPITEGFAQAFGLDDTHGFAQKLIELTKRFREWTTELGLSEEAMARLKDFASDVFSLISLLAKGIGWLVTLVADLVNVLTGKTTVGDFIDNLLTNLIGVGESGFKYWTKASEWFTKIGDTISNVYDKIKSFFSGKTDLPKLIASLGKAAFGVFPEEKVASAFNKLSSSIKKSFPVIEEFKKKLAFLDANKEGSGFNKFQNILKAIQWTAVGAFDTIKQKLATLGIDLDPIASKFQSIFDKIKMEAESFFGPIIDRIEEFKRRFETLGRNKDLTTFGRVFYALQGTARTAFHEVNKGLQDFISKHPMLQDFFDMFKGVSFTDMLASVKDALVNFGSLISEWFGPIGEKISGFYETVKSAFGKLGEDLSTLWTKMKEGMTFQDIADTIVNAFKDFGSAFDTWFEPIKQAISNKINDFVNWLEEIKPQLSEKWQGFIDFLIALIPSLGKSAATAIAKDTALDSSGGGMFSWLPEAIQNALDFILKPIESIITTFQDALAKLPPIDWNGFINQVLKFGELAVSFAGVKAGLSVFKGLKQIGNGFKEFGKSIKEFANNKTVTKNLEALTKGLADFFGNGSKSINSLFDAIKNTLKNGFTIKHKKYDSIGTTILKIAASLAILVGAIYVLTKMDPDKAIWALEKLGILAAGMITVAIIFNTMSFDGKPMLRMAISLGIILAALWAITKFPLETYLKGLIRIGLVLAELAAFSRFSGSELEFQNAPYIKLAISLAILMIPLKQIAKMDVASILKGVIGLGAIMAEFGALSKTVNTGVKTGGFIKLAIAIALLSGTMALIAKMDFASMTKGLIGLGGIILEFKAIISASQGLGKVGGFIGMAAAVAILAFVMRQLGKMDLWSAMKGIRMLGFVMTSLGTLLNNVKGLTWGSALASLVVIGGLLTEVYFAFKYLNDQNTDFTNVLKFTISIAAVAVGCGYLIKALAPVPFAAGMKALGMFAVFLVAIIALATGISVGLAYIVEKMNPEQLKKLKEDLAEASIIMGEVFNVLGSMLGGFISGVWDQTLGKFSLPQLGTDLSNFMTNVQGFLNGAKSIDSSIGQKVGALTGAILKIAGAEFLTAVANLFSEDGKTVVEHFSTDLITLGTGLSAFSKSIQGVTAVPRSIPKNVETLAKAIQTIAGAEFVTALANLFSAENKTVIDYFVTDIAKLGAGLVGFATSLEGMPENATTNMNNATSTAMGLANLVNALPKTGGIQKLLGWKDLGDFSQDLESLGNALKAYNDAIQGISGKETASAKDRSIAKQLANGLANLQNNIPESHGLKSVLSGWKDFKPFTDGIKELGSALKTYSDAIKGISKEGAASEADTKTAIEMAAGLADLQTELERTGGLHGAIWGDKSLADFATGVSGTDGVAGIGAALRAYAESISGISGLASTEDAAQAIALAQSLEDFIEGTSQVGGKIQDFTGRWDLGNFGTEVATFAAGLKIFTDLAKEIDVGASANAITVVQPIKDFIDELDKKGGIIERIKAFLGTDKYSELTRQLTAMKQMALDLKSFSTDMEGINTDQIGNATSIMEAINSFIDGIETSSLGEKIMGLIKGDSIKSKLKFISDTADTMGNFGAQFKTFADGIADAVVANANIDAASESIGKFVDLLSTGLGTGDEGTDDLFLTLQDMSNFGTQFTTFAEGIASAASAVGNFGAAANVVRSFRELQNESAGAAGEQILSQQDLLDAVNLGAQIPQALGNGVTQNEAAYTGSIDQLQAAAQTVFNGAEMDFYTIGSNLDAGLAAGVYANSAAPINAIAEVCTAMVDTANSILQVHSPSRLFMQIGDYLDQGLSLGISQNMSDPVSSISGLGDNLITAMQSAMAQVSAIASNQFDFQPQITPVVDLSNVRSGAAEYSRLFGGSIYGRMAGGISRNMAAAQNAQSAYNSMLANTPAASTGDNIQVTVNAAQGQSEEAVATSVINRISALSSRRKYAFG